MFVWHYIFVVTGNLSAVCYGDVLIMLIQLLPLAKVFLLLERFITVSSPAISANVCHELR